VVQPPADQPAFDLKIGVHFRESNLRRLGPDLSVLRAFAGIFPIAPVRLPPISQRISPRNNWLNRLFVSAQEISVADSSQWELTGAHVRSAQTVGERRSFIERRFVRGEEPGRQDQVG